MGAAWPPGRRELKRAQKMEEASSSVFSPQKKNVPDAST